MGRYLTSKLLPIFCLLPLSLAHAIEWPAGVAAKIDSILTLKQQAMDADPGMRSEDGKAGKEMEKMFSDLAALLKKEGLEDEVWKSSESDIREKIALWALDKEKRPEEYRRFSSMYVIIYYSQGLAREQFVAQFPGLEEELRRIFRLLGSKRVSAPFLIEQDAVEAFRPVIEYCLFAPPSGFSSYEDADSNLVYSLVEIGNPRSQVLYRNNLVMALKANEAILKRLDRKPSSHELHAGHEIRGLFSKPDEKTFRFLAGLWKSASLHEAARSEMDGRIRRDATIASHSNSEVFLMTWQDLARKGWEEDGERSFAGWILDQKIAPLKPRPPYEPGDPFEGDDDLD